MQIRNQERRVEEVVQFSEVAKYLSNALNSPTFPTFGRASSSAHSLPSSHHLPRLAEDVEAALDDGRFPGKT